MVWLAFALAIGCGSTDDTIDRTFDPCAFAIDTTVAGVSEALALWGLESAPGAPEIVITFEDAAPSFHGLYDDEAGMIYVNSRLTDPAARAIVIAHELGHAFGLPHIDVRTSVMNRGNLSTTPTLDDVALIASCAPPRS